MIGQWPTFNWASRTLLVHSDGGARSLQYRPSSRLFFDLAGWTPAEISSSVNISSQLPNLTLALPSRGSLSWNFVKYKLLSTVDWTCLFCSINCLWPPITLHRVACRTSSWIRILEKYFYNYCPPAGSVIDQLKLSIPFVKLTRESKISSKLFSNKNYGS